MENLARTVRASETCAGMAGKPRRGVQGLRKTMEGGKVEGTRAFGLLSIRELNSPFEQEAGMKRAPEGGRKGTKPNREANREQGTRKREYANRKTKRAH